MGELRREVVDVRSDVHGLTERVARIEGTLASAWRPPGERLPCSTQRAAGGNDVTSRVGLHSVSTRAFHRPGPDGFSSARESRNGGAETASQDVPGTNPPMKGRRTR